VTERWHPRETAGNDEVCIAHCSIGFASTRQATTPLEGAETFPQSISLQSHTNPRAEIIGWQDASSSMNQLLTDKRLPVMLAGRCAGLIVRRLAYVYRSVLLLPGVAVLFVTGCSRPGGPSPVVTVEHAISPEPPQVGPVTVILKLADTSARPVSGARITVEADMSHAGMAPVFEEASETGPGEYQAHFNLAMAGDWVVLLHIRLPGGHTLERQFNVAGVRQN